MGFISGIHYKRHDVVDRTEIRRDQRPRWRRVDIKLDGIKIAGGRTQGSKSFNDCLQLGGWFRVCLVKKKDREKDEQQPDDAEFQGR